jgi:putative ABC transport system permease protein
MDTVLQDLRYAIRSLKANPVTTAIVLATLAIGIGANALIFSAVNAVLLRPLPFAKPDELVFLFSSSPKRGVPKDVTSVPNFQDWRDQTTCFSHVAGTFQLPATLESDGGDAETSRVGWVSANFFDLLGVPPALGRGFVRQDEEGDDARVAVLSHRLWQRRFGGDPSVLGRTVKVSGMAREIVGVAAPGLDFPDDTAVYLPIALPARQRASRGSIFLPVVARLKPGVSLAQANAQLAAVSARLAKQYPDTNSEWTAFAVPFREELARDYRLAVLVLLGAVLLVLLIACANVANILLARLSARAKEISVRLALGASRARLLRQLLTESALVSVLGGAIGVGLASWGLQVLRASAPGGLPVWRGIRIDAPVLLYALGAALATGLAFGSVPAFHVMRCSLASALHGSRRVIGGSERRSQALLIVAEVALAVVLLSASGLLLKSLARLQATSPGFDPDRVLALDLKLPDARFKDDDAARRVFVNEAAARVRALPGVTAVSGATTLPLGVIYNDTNVRVDDEPEPPPDQGKTAGYDSVLPGYFAVMGIPLRAGRDVAATDDPKGPPVAVINETMAKGFWPGKDAIGRTFHAGKYQFTVVGIVGDTRRLDVMRPDRPHIYMPVSQRGIGRLSLVIKTKGRPGELIGSVRETIKAFDRSTPTDSLRPLARQLSDSVVLPRVVSGLISAFGALAMLLAALGLYGVLSFAVAQRTSEIGVRMAVGAMPKDVLLLVARRGLGLTAVGLAIGLALAVASSRLLAGLLYEVKPADPAALALASLTLVLAALAACWIPARRAARLDPVTALRTE